MRTSTSGISGTGIGRAAVAVMAATLAVAACSSPESDPVSSGGDDTTFVGLRGNAPVTFQQDRSCDDVLEDFQSLAPAVLGDQFGLATPDIAETTVAAEMSADDSAGAAPAPAADRAVEASGGDGSTSDTNTQEEGIDEPDVVETDGDFVYLVDGDQLVILDGATAQVVSRTPLAGHGAQLLLAGDRLLAVIGGGYGIAFGGPGVAVDAVAPGPGAGTVEEPPVGGRPGDEPVSAEPPPDEPVRDEPIPVEPDGGPGDIPEPLPEPVPPVPEPVPPAPGPIEPPSFPAGTVLQLIDVSDRAAPAVVETTELEGNHVSTRVVDGVARVVITSYPNPPQVFDAPMDTGGIDDVEALRATIGERAAGTGIDDWLPAFRTTTPDGDEPVEGTVVACEDVLVPEVNAGLAETSVLRVDLDDGFDPGATTTIVADAGTVYASASTLYIAATRYVSEAARAEVTADDWSTAVHAFDLRGDGAATHLGAGEVPGSTLNQYSLSEHDGYLRIATTEGTPWGGGAESESAVRVLRLDGGELTEVGMVGGLGRTETIQSVRFMGPVGYVVTFRQTDPLYVIDLSDPTSPQAVGELKIPGFSSYLHPAGEGRLIGIGRDADLEGRDRGLLLSLFDVSDPTDPRQVQTWTAADAHSAAGTDPKAFLWWAPESAVVIPMERFGAAAQGAPEGYTVGMTVLDVDDSGITERATITTADGRYPSRALVVRDRLWSLFDGGVIVSDFANPAQGTFTGYR